eukprot:CAMPEP_0118925308 /NCGR_PEP_ID=MMETSP1169-20130426/3211_1 /TAXON_ID=36882 /ORGANISM="Pyramimonas obovata, Strain CCMP722" /LENGTH=350 /DNA_ID=CAMNT_0006866559 /DNA_START=137 /DNA_END=1188 /DNA_ORIENTATION=+
MALGLAADVLQGGTGNLAVVLLSSYWAAVAASSYAALFNLLPRKWISLVATCAARGKLPASGEARANQKTRLEKRFKNMTVPHSWFTHFYIFGSLWAYFWLCNIQCEPNQGSDAQCVGSGGATAVLALFLAHTLRRLAECLWVQTFRPAATMHVAAYIFGLSYYAAMPPSLVLGSGAALLGVPSADASVAATCLHVIGGLIFTYGSAHQHFCHQRLAELRSRTHHTQGRRGGGECGYHIPHGGWFEHISCAHYTAEVVLYIGLAIMCSATPLSTSVFSVEPLSSASTNHHTYTAMLNSMDGSASGGRQSRILGPGDASMVQKNIPRVPPQSECAPPGYVVVQLLKSTAPT